MKFVIQQLEQQTVQTKYGPKQKFRFTSNGQTFDAWAKKGHTDRFAVGYSFEADLAGKPYKGVDSVQWPSNQSYGEPKFQPSNTQITDAVKIQLDRMEKKLDKLLDVQIPRTVEIIRTNASPNAQWSEPQDLQMPFDGDPAPTDDDRPY